VLKKQTVLSKASELSQISFLGGTKCELVCIPTLVEFDICVPLSYATEDASVPDVLLVQTPSRVQQLQLLKTRRPEMEAPLPLLYLAPYLLDAGFKVTIIDLRIDGTRVLDNYLKERCPLLAGLSVMPGSMLRTSMSISRRIKALSPRTKVVWGGTFPSLHSSICLGDPHVDFVCCGDGETTLLELAQILKEPRQSADFQKVKGLAYRIDGQVVVTPARQPADLEQQPVGAWALVEKYMPRYLGDTGMISINTARGCPYTCSFCYNTVIYEGFKRYRTKSVGAVMEEVHYLNRKHPVKTLLFMDDDFMANRNRGLQLLSAIHEEYPALRVRIDARADEIKDEECTAQLKAFGLESVFFGVEGVSTEFLQQIRKGCETTDAIDAARVCAKHDIAATYSFTCGYPQEKLSDLFDRVALAELIRKVHQRSRCQLELLSPIIGTSIFRDLQNQNMVPDLLPDLWAYFSDWKSAKQKPWIQNPQFYEAFQLAFFLAFSTAVGTDGQLRFITQQISNWSRYRLLGRYSRLTEYRAGNYMLKRMIWGVAA
jgi:anaerobic magnesium-protoporphyrin IX monomethyl ester cyclase